MNGSDWQYHLLQALRDGGIQPGSTVLVHSSFKALQIPGTPDDVADVLLEAVGETGTLALPTHTWATVNAKQPVFDVLLSPGCVGIIPERFRKRPGVLRSLHPTHSVAVSGQRAGELIEGHIHCSNPCDWKSPYGRLVQWDGFIVMLGVTLACNTTYHGVETWAGVPYGLAPGPQELWVIDHQGNRLRAPSYPHLWGGEWERRYAETAADLAQIGALTAIPWAQTQILVVRAKPMAEYVMERLQADPGYLLTSGG